MSHLPDPPRFHHGLLAGVAWMAIIVAVLPPALAQESAPSLVYPVDLVADPHDGGWIIADFKAHGVLRLRPSGQVESIHQGPGLPRTPLYGARAVVAAPNGDGWLVADPATFALYLVDSTGELSTVTTELDIPQGLARFDDESVLVADLRSGIGAILRVTLDGRVTVFAEVPSPKGIVADGDDGFAVVSHGDRALYRVGRDGRVSTIASGPPFDFPHDVARNSDGSFVVTDGYASALFHVSVDGTVSVITQGAPLVSPQGIVVEADGSYLVVDPQAGGVFRVTPAGQVTLVATVGPS